MESGETREPALVARKPDGSAASWIAPCLVAFSLLGGSMYGVSSVASASSSGVEIVVGLLWMNTVVTVVAIAIELRRRPYSLHLMHLLALFLFLGISALLQLSAGRFAVAGAVDGLRAELLPATGAVSLWLFTYIAVYETRRRVARRLPRDPIGRFSIRELSAPRVLVLHLPAIGALVYLGLIGLLGASTRGAAEGALVANANLTAGTTGFALALVVINQYVMRGFPLIVMMAGILMYPYCTGGARNLLRLLIPVMSLGNVLANNPLAAPRMWLVTILFGALAPLLLRRARTGLLLVGIALGGLAVLPALSESRSALSLDEWLHFSRVTSPVRYLATSADGDNLGMTALAVRWVGREGHTFGRQILGALLCWVPRRFWPDKPIGTGAMVTTDLGYGFTNWSIPIVAEGYVDFSFIGVILLATVFAWVLARGDRTYWEARPENLSGPRVIDVVYPFWLGCVLFFTRGDLISAAAHTSPFVLWAVALGLGRRTARSGAGLSAGGSDQVRAVTSRA